MTSDKPTGSDPASRPKLRSFSPEYELWIVAEHDAAPRTEKGAVLRRERLYHSPAGPLRRCPSAGRLPGVFGVGVPPVSPS